MVFKNANIFTEDFRFVKGGFTVEDGRFGKVFEGDCDCEGVDLGGATVIPGLIDVHNHGNSNADFSDGSYEGVARMAAYLGANGVTSFAPASMTLPYDVLEKAFATAAKLHAEKMQGLSERIKELADCVRDNETRTVYLGIALQAQKEAQIWQEVIGQMKICQKAAGISKRQMEMARLAEMLRKIREA